MSVVLLNMVLIEILSAPIIYLSMMWMLIAMILRIIFTNNNYAEFFEQILKLMEISVPYISGFGILFGSIDLPPSFSNDPYLRIQFTILYYLLIFVWFVALEMAWKFEKLQPRKTADKGAEENGMFKREFHAIVSTKQFQDVCESCAHNKNEGNLKISPCEKCKIFIRFGINFPSNNFMWKEITE